MNTFHNHRQIKTWNTRYIGSEFFFIYKKLLITDNTIEKKGQHLIILSHQHILLCALTSLIYLICVYIYSRD